MELQHSVKKVEGVPLGTDGGRGETCVSGLITLVIFKFVVHFLMIICVCSTSACREYNLSGFKRAGHKY